MILEPHPDLRVERRAIGAEQAPLLVIDNVVADPQRLVRKAAGRHYTGQHSMFPGIRARASLSYEYFLEALLKPLLDDGFGIKTGRFRFPMAHYSLVTLPPQRLAFLQRIPHIDSVSGNGLATVHYLFHGDWGGTAFYRHRRTGFEYVDAERREAYFRCLDGESRSSDAPSGGYIDGDTALFEQIERVDGVFNRMVVYRRNSLHSGNIDDGRIPPADPLAGRLSINTFIDVMS
ncbi:DUF6445 family protein [Luteimonas salinilitoris]|uniref:DUF6445 family protein n=1 Tax=Luteimonas salinilitoris TaxID=3237697 RepID=A0ABV4HNW2_9GAMM